MEAFRILALQAIIGVVTGHEVVQVGAGQRVVLQGEAAVGAQVVYPQPLGPRRFAGWFAVEEKHVGLDALGIEDARRQTQQGVDVALCQQVAAHRLPGAALEQHVVRHDDGRPPGVLQQGAHMPAVGRALHGGRNPD